MKQICLLLCSVIAIVLAGCASSSQEATVDSMPLYSIMTHREDDVVAIKSESGSVTFDIESPTGISSVIIGAERGVFPPEVALNLNLAGLEGLTVMYGNVRVQAGVSSTAPHDVWQTAQIGLEESQSISEGSPYWLDITIAGTESPEIPLQDGYFEAVLPDDFVTGEFEAFSAEWIDFYR